MCSRDGCNVCLSVFVYYVDCSGPICVCLKHHEFKTNFPNKFYYIVLLESETVRVLVCGCSVCAALFRCDDFLIWVRHFRVMGQTHKKGLPGLITVKFIIYELVPLAMLYQHAHFCTTAVIRA